jgi:hypothetical protein
LLSSSLFAFSVPQHAITYLKNTNIEDEDEDEEEHEDEHEVR